MSVAFDLFDCARASGTRTIAVVGTAKNVGKTVGVRALCESARARGIAYAITSIGRDGEASDALDALPKPQLTLPPGTIVATARDLVPRSPACEILGLGDRSALGAIVFVRVRATSRFEIGGPPTASGVRRTLAQLARLTDGPIFLDGAIDRIAALAGGDDAVIVATGAQSGATIERVASIAGDLVKRLSLPRDDGTCRDAIVIDGALGPERASELIARHAGARVIVSDPTRVSVRGKLFEQLIARVDLRTNAPILVVACTVSSYGRDGQLEPRALVHAVARATGRPTFDLFAGLAA